jgi:hypothetical protein
MSESPVLDLRDRNARARRGTRAAVRAPARFATAVTQRKGTYTGRGALTGILLAGYGIVLIRIVADYEPQEGGGVAGKTLHPTGQLGPLPIAVSLTASFFLLSLLAVGGGTRAKVAVILGASIVLVLAMKSTTEINTVASTFGNISKITVPAASGAEGSGAASTSPAATSSGSTGTSPGPAGSPSPAPSGNGPTGPWKYVPNTSNGEIYAQNGTCPAGWTLAGSRCLATANPNPVS